MSLKVTMTKVLGKIPVLYRFCEKMRLPETIDEFCSERAQANNELSIGQIITVLIINRLIEPTPLYKVAEWVERTGLTYILGCNAEYFNDDRLARSLDKVYPYWSSIMNKTVMICIELFSIDSSLIHYDITSLYFEGRYEDSDLVTYGYSRDQKPDKKQINLGIDMLDKEPFPILWQIYPGNTMDTNTVIENMNSLRSLLQPKKFTFIGDRAMISEEIVKHSLLHNIDIIAPLKDMISTENLLESVSKEILVESIKDKKNENELYKLGEYQIQYTNKISSPNLRAIVVWSKNKSDSAKRLREKNITRRDEALSNLKEKLNKPYFKKKQSIEKKINKIMKQNPVNELFSVNLAGNNGDLTLDWAINQEAKYELEKRDGFYVLGTTASEAEMSTLEIFKAYKRQYIAERSFSDLKTTIGIRPIFLQINERIEGLVHITVLALCVYNLLEILLKRNNINIRTKRMFEQFVGLVLIQLLLPDKSLEFQVGPLPEREEQFLKALKINDIDNWVLSKINKQYRLNNKMGIC